MSNLREAFSSTHHANLGWQEHEAAIDRVAAAGRAERIGVCLWKARYMLEAWAYQESNNLLLKRFISRYKAEDAGVAQKIVSQALQEFLLSFCSTCLGAKELIDDDLKIICEDCGGSGVKRYTDRERARSMQMSLQRYRSVSHKLAWVQRLINEEESRVNYVLNVELERFSIA